MSLCPFLWTKTLQQIDEMHDVQYCKGLVNIKHSFTTSFGGNWKKILLLNINHSSIEYCRFTVHSSHQPPQCHQLPKIQMERRFQISNVLNQNRDMYISVTGHYNSIVYFEMQKKLKTRVTRHSGLNFECQMHQKLGLLLTQKQLKTHFLPISVHL